MWNLNWNSMKWIFKIILISITLMLFAYCSDENNFSTSGSSESIDTLQDSDNSDEWSIPKDEVYDGGPGKDGIPSIDNPSFIEINEVDFLENEDLVIGMKIDGQAKAYPHKIMNWHEIVNDQIAGQKVSITYCPLTGTAISWNRVINGQETTFGVSGLLYNSNLIPYDRKTDSRWSQMRMDCVYGDLKGEKPDNYQVIETEWKTWKNMYPDSKVLSTQTGYRRDYDRYPYGDYKSSDKLLFPVNPEDNRLFSKERVLGIINDNKSKTYRFQLFSNSTRLIRDEFKGMTYLIVGNKTLNLLTAFNLSASNIPVNTKFQSVENSLPMIVEDSNGNKYDIFGNQVTGPHTDYELVPANSFIGFWFSWGAFYPEPLIYEAS